jgi:hypothetical protein
MKFSHLNGEGFTVTKYVPREEDGIVNVFILAGALDDDANSDDPQDCIEVEVVVKLPPEASLQQIEKAARKRARLILEAAIAVIDPDEAD